MSADNWTKCPNCKKLAVAKREQQLKHVEKSYGKVTPEEYLKLVKDAEEKNPVELLEETLREDYEIGVYGESVAHKRSEAIFYVSYRAGCKECGWSYMFKKEEPLKL